MEDGSTTEGALTWTFFPLTPLPPQAEEIYLEAANKDANDDGRWFDELEKDFSEGFPESVGSSAAEKKR